MESQKNGVMCQICYGFKCPRGYTQMLFECRCIEEEMVLLTELPIFKDTCLDFEKVLIQEEATKICQQNENDDNDTDSGIGDSAPPSPTWTYDGDAGENPKQSDRQYSLNERLNMKFIYDEKSRQEATDDACSSHYNDTTIAEQTMSHLGYVPLNSIQSKSNDLHDLSNNHKNSSHLFASTMIKRPKNIVSNSIFVLNSSLPQHSKSLKSSLVYENNDSNDLQAKDKKELPSGLTNGFNQKKTIDDKKLCRDYIKSCVRITFKSLTKSFNKETNDKASQTIRSSSEVQSWADIRMLPNVQQDL